ncbi:hypothetical protein TNCV_3672821 [Trichonephila clavipes]|nr:hypothetical protein TNCV_3672821 [Trichonephila clavipes]
MFLCAPGHKGEERDIRMVYKAKIAFRYECPRKTVKRKTAFVYLKCDQQKQYNTKILKSSVLKMKND